MTPRENENSRPSQVDADAPASYLSAQRAALRRALSGTAAPASDACPTAALDAVMEGLPMAAIVSDGAGQLVCGNEAARRLLDVTAEEVPLIGIDMIAAGEDSALSQRLLHLLEVKPSVQMQVRMIRREQPAVDAAWNIGRLTLGSKDYLLILIQDARAQQQISAVLAAARGQLTRARKMESTVSIASQVVHDLQNQLTPLVAYPDLLRRSHPHGDSSRELLDRMQTSVASISRTLLQFQTLLHRGRHLPAPLNLNEIAAQAASALRDIAADRPIQILVDLASDPPPIDGVREPLSRAAENLCRHALEASRDGGRITVATRAETLTAPAGCRRHIPAGAYVTLSVAHTGASVTPDLQHRLLRPFSAASASESPLSLGWIVVREVMDDHRGFLDVSGEAERGSVFSLWLPAPVVEGTAPVAKAEDSQRTDRILIVDDEVHIRRLFQMVLTLAFPRAEIETAAGGAEAIECFQSRRPGVIVLDLRMPEVDGETVFREIDRLCRDSQWRMPTVLFCTGFAPPEFIRRIAESGKGHRILMKPITEHALVDAVKPHLASAP